MTFFVLAICLSLLALYIFTEGRTQVVGEDTICMRQSDGSCASTKILMGDKEAAVWAACPFFLSIGFAVVGIRKFSRRTHELTPSLRKLI